MSNAVSRYRSQRKPNQDGEECPGSATDLPNPPSSPPQEDSVVRSKSRYRRKDSVGGPRPSTAANSGSSPQAVPAISPQTKPARYASQKQTQPLQQHASTSEKRSSPQSQAGAQDMRRTTSNDRMYEKDMDRKEQLKAQSHIRQQEQQSKGTAHSSHAPQANSLPIAPTKPSPAMKYSPPKKPAAISPPLQATTDDLHVPSQKLAPRRDEAPRSENISATKSAVTQPRYEFEKDDESDGGGGCFGLFKRKRQQQSPVVSEKVSTTRPTTSKENRDMKIAGGSAVMGVDAPLSAVNAGDRRVIIHFNGRNITLPVNPTTTPIDLIKSSSIVLSDRVEVKSAVLLEEFSTVGVQRPLRRYEHVRDIMNSWDDDKQNKLILVDPGTGSSEVELSLQGVPDEQPGDQGWFMHYSQKPGKWDRRYVSLRQDGQLLVAKDPDKLREAQNLCHLSDFDIYTPTLDKIRKKVKPPKKYCYAIKSQQKSSMFESSNNFVHFVSVAEKREADLFYAAVQGWRSWYLVNVLGEGSKIKIPPPANAVEAQEVREEAKREDSGGPAGGHRKMESLDSHYQLGSFQPLIDMDLDNFGGDDARPQTSRSQARGIIPGNALANARASEPERAKSSRRKNPPPYLKKSMLAEDEPLANLDRKRASLDVGRNPIEATDKASPLRGDFADTGLLGRTYSQKRKEVEERELRKPSPWTLGPNLLNSGFDSREEDFSTSAGRTSMDTSGMKREKSVRNRSSGHKTSSGELGRSRSTRDRGASIDLQRSGSRRGGDAHPPKPLIDLTPQYREPPQHQKKGHGHKPDHIGPGGLIDAATSPEDPLNVPPSVDWRGRNTQHQQPDARQSRARSHSRAKQGVPGRSLSQHRPTTSSRNAPPPIPSPQDDEAFTGEGLLAHDGSGGWGSAQKGRGVMDGSHARGPMIDMSQESKFAQGSLLNKVEKEQGGPLAGNLIIDREKRRERNVATGEAY